MSIPNVARDEFRFLINQDSLHINCEPLDSSPLHAGFAYLLGMLTKQVAYQILHAETQDMPSLAAKLVGRALLGGYCTMIQINPLTFKYIRGSTSVVAAKKEDFDRVQQAGNVVLDNFSDEDLEKTDFYFP